MLGLSVGEKIPESISVNIDAKLSVVWSTILRLYYLWRVYVNRFIVNSGNNSYWAETSHSRSRLFYLMIYYQNTTDITDAITRSATADTQKHQRGACIHTIQSTADDGHARSGSLAAEHRVPISVSSAANGAAPKSNVGGLRSSAARASSRVWSQASSTESRSRRRVRSF